MRNVIKNLADLLGFGSERHAPAPNLPQPSKADGAQRHRWYERIAGLAGYGVAHPSEPVSEGVHCNIKGSYLIQKNYFFFLAGLSQ